MTLETKRLILRSFDDSDIETIYALVYTDPEVRDPWSGFRGSLNDFRERFRTNRNWKIEDGFGYFALTRRTDEQLLGLMGFQNHAHEPMDWLLMPDAPCSRTASTLSASTVSSMPSVPRTTLRAT